MKKVLVITYYWPPSGGAAVQRWLSFVNLLQARGFEVHLLTVDPAQATFQLYDESLVKQIHPGVKVHTTSTWEPFELYKKISGKKSVPKPAFADETNPTFTQKVFRFIRGNFFIPDPRKGWKKFAVPKALEVIQQEGIEAVITAGPPHSTHFIGLDLKRQAGVKWIADFHDLWTDVIYYNQLYHLPWVAKKDLELERYILEQADHVLTVGNRYRDKLLSKSPALSPAKFTIARIGFDSPLFESPLPPADDHIFRIVYTGTMGDFYHPEIFINALSAIVKRYPELPTRFEIAGVLANGIMQQLHEAGLDKHIIDHGYLSHTAAVTLMRNAHCLLLVNPVTTDEPMVIPGKLYEYLAAAKPIINITVKEAETADLILQCGAGKTFERNQQHELEAYLEMLLQRWQQQQPLLDQYRADNVAAFSREAITGEIARLLA